MCVCVCVCVGGGGWGVRMINVQYYILVWLSINGYLCTTHITKFPLDVLDSIDNTVM